MRRRAKESRNGGEPPGPPTSLRRNRDFLLLWSGQAVSSMGSQVSLLAFPLLILAVTHSPAEAGLLAGLAHLPDPILSLPAGAVADRWDRKWLMVASDAVRAVALGSIPLAVAMGHLSFLQLAVVSLLDSTFGNVFGAAASAALPRVVREEQLPNAIAAGSITDSSSRVVAPALMGALYTLSRSLPFLVDAISYLVSVISLLFIRTRFQERRAPSPGTVWSESREGLAWLWRHPQLRFQAVLTGGLNLSSFGYALILIVRVHELHGGSLAIGWLFAVGSIGSLIGSLAVAPLRRRFNFGQIMLGATWGWVLTWVPYALAPNLPALFAADIFGWPVVSIFLVTQYTYRITLAPDELRGRVNSVFRLLTVGVEPLSLALAGALLQLFGGVTTIWLIIVPQLLLAVIATLSRHLLRIQPVQPQ